MSAFIVQPEHLGILAAYATTVPDRGRALEPSGGDYDLTILKAQRIAELLAVANIAAVAISYPYCKDGDRPGPAGLTDAQIVEGAKLWAAHYVAHGTACSLTPVQVIKLCTSLDYQCVEDPQWITTPAAAHLRGILCRAVTGLAGYDAASWVWDDNGAPHLDALIYGEDA